MYRETEKIVIILLLKVLRDYLNKFQLELIIKVMFIFPYIGSYYILLYRLLK